jgi:YD repeat-containing protein
VAKSGSGLAPIASSASFAASCANPKRCNQPLTTTDARGFTTDYAYDATHGGLVSVTLPAQPNGVRPQTRYGYALLNGEYQLTSISACQTLSSCTGTADEVKTTLGYDANGNVTGASAGAGDGSLTATQAMTYDPIGNLLTVDGPISGNGDITRYRYNAARERIGTNSADPDGGGSSIAQSAIRSTRRGSSSKWSVVRSIASLTATGRRSRAWKRWTSATTPMRGR